MEDVTVPIDSATIIEQMDTLIAVYAGMRTRAQYEDLSDLPDDEMVELVSRLNAAIFRMSPRSSTYAVQAKEASGQPVFQLPVLVGIARAIKADVEAGWVTTVEELLHADTFADLLGQASELATKGYKDAAAVVAGSVLEAHLRLLCGKFSVSTTQSSGTSKKATTMNADLVKSSAYNSLQQKSVESWQAVRNAAAHGEYGKYDAMAVSNMIAGVESFMANNPA
jgi:hypothetical protein